MPKPKRPEELSEILTFGPWRFPQYDPGPPWWWDVVSQEVQVELVLSQLQTEKEVLAAVSKALDRQIAILSRKQ